MLTKQAAVHRAARLVGGRVEVTLDPLPGWLRYKGKWGSTVVAPALQEWCVGRGCGRMALSGASAGRSKRSGWPDGRNSICCPLFSMRFVSVPQAQEMTHCQLSSIMLALAQQGQILRFGNLQHQLACTRFGHDSIFLASEAAPVLLTWSIGVQVRDGGEPGQPDVGAAGVPAVGARRRQPAGATAGAGRRRPGAHGVWWVLSITLPEP